MPKVHACVKCKSKLFVRWGLAIVITPDNWKRTAMGKASSFADKQDDHELFACAQCKQPYYFDDNELIDAGEMVSSEEVEAALNALRSMPTGAKARHIDP